MPKIQSSPGVFGFVLFRTPSHTSKDGRRYRYYVCQATRHGNEATNKCARLPAFDVERQVTLKLQSFLRSGKNVMDQLSQPEDPPLLTQQILAAATKRGKYSG